jgi:glutamate synthase (NADPH/NADH) large chain
MTLTSNKHLPAATGLYDPQNEKDACGVGFVAHIKGERSHQIILDSDHLACRMDHRGARGSEKNTGDGAGMLTALPHEFLIKVAKQDLNKELPAPGKFSAGNVFLPTDDKEREFCKQVIETIIAEEGQELIGWRPVPTDAEAADIGPTARNAQPVIEQLFIAAGQVDGKQLEGDAFERALYLIRKRATHKLRSGGELTQAEMFYVCSLSTKVLIYKGMLTPGQVRTFYLDLQDEDYTSHLAMVHSRFSTNTFPSWDRAQPMRFMSHNGEINTLRGNMNWMRAREGVAQSELFGDKLQDIFPVIDPDVSDSGAFDNVLEFLLMTGRSLQAATMMMVPEAWQKNDLMSKQKKAFYEFHSAMMEPWDGPASIAFTDGRYIGAVLDRNGLRPSRYYITKDDRVIMASEVGVVPVDPANVERKGRLEPGKMFLVDFEQGRLIPDEELKNTFAEARPYKKWIEEQRMYAKELDTSGGKGLNSDTLLERMQALGFTTETMQFMLIPLVTELRDPVGSMGNDSALAVLSDKPRMVYDYFKQLFAQVTNPPIDSIREEIIMSLECYIGPEANLLTLSEKNCHRMRLRHPILSNPYLEAIRNLDERGWKTKTIDITYPAEPAVGGLTATLERICAEAEQAIDDGFSFVVLSDRAMGKDRIAVSALLATGAVHHHLVRQAKRTRIGLVVETGEAREVHHHCMLVGYGADAINPYLAFEALWQARRDGLLNEEDFPDDDSIVAAYRKAVAKGMLKVMAKMGISTLQSYKGAQIFEAVGIRDEVIERCFDGTASRLQGVGFAVLEEEARRRHKIGYPDEVEDKLADLPNPGDFHWRSAGERHAWNPKSISALQLASRQNDHNAYDRFAAQINADARTNCTLRGLLDFKIDEAKAIPLDEVEPASEIVKRFVTGAMSFGSISKESHEALAIAMNRLGGKSNTGEGGEDPIRFTPLPSGDSKRSAIKQIASGRFGVTAWYLTNADELQIKMAQGAKPGEGGELPGGKVDEIISLLDPRRGVDLAAAASRYLFHRRSGAADPRLKELQPECAHQREAGERSGRGYHRCGRSQGARRPHSGLR